MPPSRSGPSGTDERAPAALDRHAGLEARGVLVDLGDDLVAAQLDDFAEQAALADGECLEDAEGAFGARAQHRAADPGDACAAHASLLPGRWSSCRSNSASSSAADAVARRPAARARSRRGRRPPPRMRSPAPSPSTATNSTGRRRPAARRVRPLRSTRGAAGSASTLHAARGAAGCARPAAHAARAPMPRAPAPSSQRAASATGRRSQAARGAGAAVCWRARRRARVDAPRAVARSRSRPRARDSCHRLAHARAGFAARATQDVARLRLGLVAQPARPRFLFACQPPQQGGRLGFEHAFHDAHASIPSALRTCARDVRAAPSPRDVGHHARAAARSRPAPRRGTSAARLPRAARTAGCTRRRRPRPAQRLRRLARAGDARVEPGQPESGRRHFVADVDDPRHLNRAGSGSGSRRSGRRSRCPRPGPP